MKEKPKKKKLDQGKRMFLYMLPFLLLCFAFSYFPLHGWIYSFYDYKPPLKLSQCNFMGLRWFKMIFVNPAQVRQLFIVMRNTFAMSWVLVYAVAFCLFSNTGMVNTVLQNLGVILKPIKFLDSDSHTYIAMLLWSTWKGLGWGAIMYLASIAGIDQEMYEAARVDGAGRFQLMRYITLPELMPTYFVMLMLSVANFLNNGMDQYFVFQNAFNKAHIQVLDLYVYNIGMTGSSLSLATAISMLKSLISVTLLMAVNRISKKIRGVSLV